MDPRQQQAMMAQLLMRGPNTFAPSNTQGPMGAAPMRSESTDHARAIDFLKHHRDFSILGAMLQPNQASLNDAIRAPAIDTVRQTGYYPWR